MFSVWQSNTGSHFVRLQFLAQTLDQMHNAVPLSLSNPPAIANIFVPGCSTPEEGFPCEWRLFQQVIDAAIDPSFVK
jgi:glucose-1-phosphatase